MVAVIVLEIFAVTKISYQMKWNQTLHENFLLSFANYEYNKHDWKWIQRNVSIIEKNQNIYRFLIQCLHFLL